MGDVWRARDTDLARFEREAKRLAQLRHPNIASIFGLEENDGSKAFVIELDERIEPRRGPNAIR